MEELTWEIIEDNLDLPWHWGWISEHPCVTFEIIKDNLHLKWKWYHILRNPNITYDIIQENPDMPWDYSYIDSVTFYRHRYFKSTIYKKKLVKEFMENCWEELIQEACHPSRILNWNDDYLEECKNGTNEEKELYLAECNKYK
jgi:hypothetical protein